MDPSRAQTLAFLRRLAAAVEQERVFVSAYAADRATEDLQWDQWDIIEQLKDITFDDLRHCECSRAPTADLIWVFTPELWDGGHLWIRLIERDGIVVVSFHRA